MLALRMTNHLEVILSMFGVKSAFMTLCLSPVGPLCEYMSNVAAQTVLEDCTASLSQYEQLLTPPETNCGSNTTTNSFTWTPDDDTPDLVYYQVCVCVCVCVCVYTAVICFQYFLSVLHI